MAFVKAYFGDFSKLELNPRCGKFVFAAIQKNERHTFDLTTDCGIVAYWQNGAVDSSAQDEGNPSERIVFKFINEMKDVFQHPFAGQSVFTDEWVSPDHSSFYDLHHCVDVEKSLTEFNLLYGVMANLKSKPNTIELIAKKTGDKDRSFIQGLRKTLLTMKKTFNSTMLWEGKKYSCPPGDGTVYFYGNATTCEENKNEGLRIADSCDAIEYVVPRRNSDSGKVLWRKYFSGLAKFGMSDEEIEMDDGRKTAVFGAGCIIGSVVIGKEYEILSKKKVNDQVYFQIRNEKNCEVFVNSKWAI